MSNQENRKHNTSIVTGRIDGKFLQNGDPRGGGERTVVVCEQEFHKAIMVPVQEVWARLGLTDERKPYKEMGPAVIPLSMQIARVADRYGKPIAYKETIFNTDGSIQSEITYQI